ncbi:glycosyltransferase family 4 protein [uncultured Roseibium sp.]|uniref:glycosyltransferase family 4 protein n=1 Tax=uncultured Roseibium sp. TaxID=1936171 RepID=UPI00261C80EA|nr:glycosyltransferase family 4 protein [uncultured Roseibium sp.]
MKIAFTAPMKPLDHPVPSGDRTMGRLIVKALRAAGHEIEVASTFRSWRKDGSDELQSKVKAEALKEVSRIANTWKYDGSKPDLFLTYHLYHKAPDWIGPALAERFDLPYAIIEASRAPKRKTGNWAFGFAAADTALRQADAVAAIHNADAECLREVVPADRLEVLLPFLDAEPYQQAASTAKPPAAAPLKLLAVGMMREGDKFRSYQVLAGALDRLMQLPWHLTLIGDGPVRSQVVDLFPADRITYLGALGAKELPAQYAQHDLVVWPAIREAFGLVLMEAQAAGTGVVAGNTFGVPDIVRQGETGLLSQEGDVEAFAAHLENVIKNPGIADRLGMAASAYISANHSLEAGAARLNLFARKAVENHKRTQKDQGI